VPDQLLDRKAYELAQSAIAALPSGSLWERFERLRLRDVLAISTGVRDRVSPETESAASGLIGIERVRGAGAIAVVEALTSANADREWVASLADARSIIRSDRTRSARVANLVVALVAYPFLLVGGLSAAAVIIVGALIDAVGK
jgi:hypothetical protein